MAIFAGRSLASWACGSPVVWRRLYSVKWRALLVASPNSMFSGVAGAELPEAVQTA
jgi:hypothetical protein